MVTKGRETNKGSPRVAQIYYLERFPSDSTGRRWPTHSLVVSLSGGKNREKERVEHSQVLAQGWEESAFPPPEGTNLVTHGTAARKNQSQTLL